MSLEHSPARSEPATVASLDSAARAPPDASDYWQALINEKAAGEFVGLKERAMQSYRQKGDGPHYIRISSRCIRYRRIDLKSWVDARLRKSTSDPDQAA